MTEISATDTGNKNYYAKWEFVSYTITYDLGEGTEDGNPNTYTVESGNITQSNPSKTGCTFTGWSGTGLTGDGNMVADLDVVAGLGGFSVDGDAGIVAGLVGDRAALDEAGHLQIFIESHSFRPFCRVSGAVIIPRKTRQCQLS
mgnify:CR=1 FL=1